VVVTLTGLGTSAEIDRLTAGAFDYLFLEPADPDGLLRVLSVRAGGHCLF
jgi:hypothetical protein